MNILEIGMKNMVCFEMVENRSLGAAMHNDIYIYTYMHPEAFICVLFNNLCTYLHPHIYTHTRSSLSARNYSFKYDIHSNIIAIILCTMHTYGMEWVMIYVQKRQRPQENASILIFSLAHFNNEKRKKDVIIIWQEGLFYKIVSHSQKYISLFSMLLLSLLLLFSFI